MKYLLLFLLLSCASEGVRRGPYTRAWIYTETEKYGKSLLPEYEAYVDLQCKEGWASDGLGCLLKYDGMKILHDPEGDFNTHMSKQYRMRMQGKFKSLVDITSKRRPLFKQGLRLVLIEQIINLKESDKYDRTKPIKKNDY